MAAKSDIISFRLPASIKKKLDLLKEATGRQRTALVVEAIDKYLETESWQIAVIQEGVAQADAGEFVSLEDVKAKWMNKQ